MEKTKKILYYAIICLIFTLGIFIRTKLYLTCNYFEDDECRLALAMYLKRMWQIFTPIGALSCTPIFLLISKFIANITNYNEYALKFIPYACSIGSLFLFYKICGEYFKRKISICLSLFLFSINFHSIFFSSFFKTYSVEILITLICIYYFPKINITELTKKQMVYTSAAITVLPLISLPSVYFIGIFFLISAYQIIKNKTSFLPLAQIVIPFSAVMVYYYISTLAPTKVMQMQIYTEVWEQNLTASVISVFAVILTFFNKPNHFILANLMLICAYIVYTILNKQEWSKINIYIILGILIPVLCSSIGIYPLTVGRTAMFLLPLFILASIRLFDILNYKKLLFYIVCLLIISSYYKYFQPEYFTKILDTVPTFRNYSPKTLMTDMIAQYNPKTDVVITTEASMYSYMFYAIKQDFSMDNLDEKSVKNNFKTKDAWFDYLNSLSPNKNYWFYLVKEFKTAPARNFVLEWLKGQNIIYSKQENNSYLYYIHSIKRKEL